MIPTTQASDFRSDRFPHSDIPGSKLATQLPEAYRSYATSFIGLLSQGIHQLPLTFTKAQRSQSLRLIFVHLQTAILMILYLLIRCRSYIIKLLKFSATNIKKSREAGSFSDQNRGDLYPLLCLIWFFLNIIATTSICLYKSGVNPIKKVM